MELQNLLKTSKLAEFIPYEDIKNLRIERVQKDNFIYSDCDYSYVFLILKGLAAFCHNHLEKTAFFPILYKKDFFIGDHVEKIEYKAHAKYLALEDTIVAYIPREKMNSWKKQYPELLNYLYESITERDFTVTLYHYIRLHKGLKASIAFLIYTYANNDIFHYNGTSQFASKLNSSRKHVFYSLKSLEEDEIIKKTSKTEIKILNKKKLKNVFESEIFDY